MGFAQEMKDFFGTAEKTYKTLDDAEYKKAMRRYYSAQSQKLEDANSDTESHDIEKEGKRLKNEATKAQIKLLGQRGALYGAKIKALSQPAIGAGPIEAPVLPGAQGYGAAIPVTPQVTQPAIGPQSALEPDEDDELQPTAAAAKGGLIQKFADGGLVEDDDLDDEEAVPAIGGADTDFSSQARPKYSVDAASDAVAAGLRYGTAQLGQSGAVMTPARQRALQAYTRGQDAVTPQEMQMVYQKIDPQHRLTDSERNLSALGAIWQFKMSKNDTVGAQKAAFQMLQHLRVASQRYAAISAAAAEHGDINGAVKAAVKSYASIPDGRDLKVQMGEDGKIQYSIVDQQTGKTITGGIATPDQLAAQAMSVATQGFDKFLLDVAGQRSSKKGAVDPNAAPTMKVRDRKDMLGMIDDAYTRVAPKDEKSGEPSLPANEQRMIVGSSSRMFSDPRNNGLTPDEAIEASMRLASPDPKKPDEQGFTVKKADGGYLVKFGKKRDVFVPADDFAVLASTRAEKIAALRKHTEESSKPGMLDGVGDKIMGAIGAAGEYVSDLRDRNKKAIGDMDEADQTQDRDFMAKKRAELVRKRDADNGK